MTLGRLTILGSVLLPLLAVGCGGQSSPPQGVPAPDGYEPDIDFSALEKIGTIVEKEVTGAGIVSLRIELNPDFSGSVSYSVTKADGTQGGDVGIMLQPQDDGTATLETDTMLTPGQRLVFKVVSD